MDQRRPQQQQGMGHSILCNNKILLVLTKGRGDWYIRSIAMNGIYGSI